MKNVIPYQRVSTGNQTHSLKKQSELISKYCLENQFVIVESYLDVCSDKDFIRPQFNRLLQMCMSKPEKVDMILVSDWSRFGRDKTEVEQMVNSLSELGIEVKSINE